MFKKLLRAGSLVSAVVIGGVLVVRASGCTTEKPAPVIAPPPPAPPPPAPAASDAGTPVVDAGTVSAGFKLPDEAFLPATKAAAPVFHPEPEVAQQGQAATPK